MTPTTSPTQASTPPRRGAIPARERPIRRDVSFPSDGSELVGHLYLPADYDERRRLPGVVVTGAWTTVKEQMPAIYAAEMAARGFAALTFDFRGWGRSAGTPKFLEHPERKTRDIVAAAEFLVTRPEVDAARIGGLGVCASAGYMSDATLRSPIIRVLGLVAPWLHDPAIAESVYGGLDRTSQLIRTGREAVAADPPNIIEAASTTNEGALMYQAPYYTEPDRGLIEEYDNAFNLASWEPWLTYDALRIGESLRKPTLAVHSEAAVIPHGVKEFARRMGGCARIDWLEDVSQFDFYDQPGPVATSADAIAAHFTESFRDQQDVAGVKNVVEGVTALVDLGQFEALETLYAEEVLVDYASLTGEPAARQTARSLMSSWAGALPGFDRTRHELHDVHVDLDGTSAVATADFTADHYVGDLFWRARGTYRFSLQKQGRSWLIDGHAMTLKAEAGTRDALSAATLKASKQPSPLLVRQNTQDTVRTLLTSLETKDMTAFAALWAEDAAQEMPFAPHGFPKEIRGRQAVLEHYASWPRVSGNAEFTNALKFYPLQDPQWIFATFTGRVDVIPTGRIYEQTYGGLFHVVQGEIQLFREYFDPAPFVRAFDLQDAPPNQQR